MKQELASPKSSELNGSAERAMGVIKNAALAARIQAPTLNPHVERPLSDAIWGQTIRWACGVLNHTATISNLGDKSLHDIPARQGSP